MTDGRIEQPVPPDKSRVGLLTLIMGVTGTAASLVQLLSADYHLVGTRLRAAYSYLPLNLQPGLWPLYLVFFPTMLVIGEYEWKQRQGRIPNWITVPGALLGVGVNFVLGSQHIGIRGALAGAAVSLLVLLPLVVFRAFGAGAWKMMAMMGAFLGIKGAGIVFLLACCLASMSMGLYYLRKRPTWLTKRNPENKLVIEMGPLVALAGCIYVLFPLDQWLR
jgi:Flp pilus assembly protein protease CpaA